MTLRSDPPLRSYFGEYFRSEMSHFEINPYLWLFSSLSKEELTNCFDKLTFKTLFWNLLEWVPITLSGLSCGISLRINGRVNLFQLLRLREILNTFIRGILAISRNYRLKLRTFQWLSWRELIFFLKKILLVLLSFGLKSFKSLLQFY